jgi:hypothetical protein
MVVLSHAASGSRSLSFLIQVVTVGPLASFAHAVTVGPVESFAQVVTIGGSGGVIALETAAPVTTIAPVAADAAVDEPTVDPPTATVPDAAASATVAPEAAPETTTEPEAAPP